MAKSNTFLSLGNVSTVFVLLLIVAACVANSNTEKTAMKEALPLEDADLGNSADNGTPLDKQKVFPAPETELMTSGSGTGSTRRSFMGIIDLAENPADEASYPVFIVDDGIEDDNGEFSKRSRSDKRRLRFIKRRLRFVRRNGKDENEETPLDKRRLRFIKRRLRFVRRNGKDENEEPPLDKRRLRFIKKTSLSDVSEKYKNNNSKQSSEISSNAASRQQADLNTKAQRELPSSSPSSSSSSLSSSPHFIHKRSVPAPIPPAVDSDLSLGALTSDPKRVFHLSKRLLSINQPLVLLTHMVMEEQRKKDEALRKKLLEMGKRSVPEIPMEGKTVRDFPQDKLLKMGKASLNSDLGKAPTKEMLRSGSARISKRLLSINQPLILLTHMVMEEQRKKDEALRKKLLAMGKRSDTVMSKQMVRDFLHDNSLEGAKRSESALVEQMDREMFARVVEALVRSLVESQNGQPQ